MTTNGTLQTLKLSRRSFLITVGSMSVAVAVGCSREEAADSPAARQGAAFDPNAWVSIDSDGIVTIMSAPAEMGQGIMTGLPVCVAEDLDADWALVRVVQSPAKPEIYGNPKLGMELSTHGDYSVQGYYEPLRLIGAQTRLVLLHNAARIWGVDAAELVTKPGQVLHPGSGRRLDYGSIAAQAEIPDPLPEVTVADLKPESEWRLIGQSVPRVDIPSKTDGSAVYGIDVRLPGMLYGSIAYSPVPYETIEAFDSERAEGVAGVVKIINFGEFAGVIAETVEAAMKAKSLLDITWTESARARAYDSSEVAREYGEIAGDLDKHGVEMASRGDVPAAIEDAAQVVSRVYFSDHIAHTTMEPGSAVAQIDDDKVDVWLSTQSPSMALPVCAEVAGTTQENVTVHSMLLGGGFGRRSEAPDTAREAVMLAKEVVGRPVKLIRSREDDFYTGKFRPLAAQRIDAGLDEDGNIVAWRQRVVCASAWARFKPALFGKMQGRDIVASLVDAKYQWPNHLVQFIREERGWDVGPWRGISIGYTGFAVEAMIDELAELSGRDPLQFRRDHLKDDARALAVLDAVVADADWDRARENGRGLGLAMSTMSGSYAAGVAEISIDEKTGKIRLHEMWVTLDAGLVVHPDAVVAQMEGGAVMGLGAALYERIDISAGKIRQNQFGPYQPPRLSQVPDAVHVRLVPSDGPPAGVGEIGVTLVAPAIASAVARMTGKRLRRLPMSPERVRNS